LPRVVEDVTSTEKPFYYFNVLSVLANPRNVIEYKLIGMYNDFVLLSIYGVISPFCAVALLASIVSQVTMLIIRINFYCRSQVTGPTDERNIEVICKYVMRHNGEMMWPPFIATSFFFALYVFDMALDTDHQDSYKPWVLLVVTVYFF